jgi:hypothetical protein
MPNVLVLFVLGVLSVLYGIFNTVFIKVKKVVVAVQVLSRL